MPDSHNAGDFGSALIGAPHEYAITADQLELRTDGHMDIDAVRPGAILLAPVNGAGRGHLFRGYACVARGTARLPVYHGCFWHRDIGGRAVEGTYTGRGRSYSR